MQQVGIHIRAADLEEKDEGAVSYRHIAAWTNCAKQLDSNRRISKDQQVLWYLATDSARAYNVIWDKHKNKV